MAIRSTWLAGFVLVAVALVGCEPAKTNRQSLNAQLKEKHQRQRDDEARAATVRAGPSPGAVYWFTADLNSTNCFLSGSPADRIRMIQDAGYRAETRDKADGVVEVGYRQDDSNFRYWTYYRSQQRCVSDLPRAQPIPGKYE